MKSAVTPSFFKSSSSSSSTPSPLPPQTKEDRRTSTIIHPEAFNSSFTEYNNDQSEADREPMEISDATDRKSTNTERSVSVSTVSSTPESLAGDSAQSSQTDASHVENDVSSGSKSTASSSSNSDVETQDSINSGEIRVNPEESESTVLAFASSNEEPTQTSAHNDPFLPASSGISSCSSGSMALEIPTEPQEPTVRLFRCVCCFLAYVK